ncbi:L,D-transpeptidase [Bosea sp. BIWAKO-01]|uniref:L,D-transpeptidase family protein n=1 Tax=Bosea sp. BIWAKO-01 TaxID=506668 RepID=UPI0008535775|nr:L,D-transpeptidase [Bosea sp. BIWAKO-01]GAU84209.1 protein ERFK/SRFK [Bosea sp. BIWAKO-01]
MKPVDLMTTLVVLLGLGAVPASALTAEQVNTATFAARTHQAANGPNPFIVKAQALLARRGISPGVIDGVDGENFRKAVGQFRRQENLGESDELDEVAWLALGGGSDQDVVVEYKLSNKDTEYDFADDIPRDYAKQAKMKRLSYTSPQEMLGERFHMSEKLLMELNPGLGFTETGSGIYVLSGGRSVLKGGAKRIDAVKSTGMLIVYGEGDTVLASYPATIGSKATPSLTGQYTVTRIARNPNYTYDPEKNFQQGKNDETLVLPPGPNNPVGTIWIALSEPTFGIHGTPEPSQVSKTTSHGCVRLTNWDAEELGDLVRPGVPVQFLD